MRQLVSVSYKITSLISHKHCVDSVNNFLTETPMFKVIKMR
jgi:hypothetical protein